MKRNELKIVSNPLAGRIAYFFRNEYGEWNPLSSSSPLSRQTYTNTTLRDSAEKIVRVADEIYNRKKKGLDIYFAGTQEEFACLQNAIKDEFPDRNIQCCTGTTKIAVVGKRGVGKSCLIDGLQSEQGYEYRIHDEEDYILYQDNNNNAQWFEIKGIDLGCEHVRKAFSVVENLSKQGLSHVVYCVSAITGRLEETEKDFIMELVQNFPELTVLVVLTMSYRADADTVVDEIEKLTDQIKVIKTLAKKYAVRSRGTNTVLEPYGLDLVCKYIFEGR